MKETRLSFLESITFDGHILVAVPSKQENKSIFINLIGYVTALPQIPLLFLKICVLYTLIRFKFSF